MPRIPRIFQQSLCYHVMNRGVNRQCLFRDDHDRRYFTELVGEYKSLCSVRVYHWAWMANHFHLLVEVAFPNLRPFVAGIQQAYAQYHHARHGTSGVFWQGRFKSKPVEIGEYLTRCGRYIERNPVCDRKVAHAWEYGWSSAAFYVLGHNDGLTDPDPYIAGPGVTPASREEYAAALQSGVDEEWMRGQRARKVIGSAAFAGGLRVMHGRYRRKRGRPARGVRIKIEPA